MGLCLGVVGYRSYVAEHDERRIISFCVQVQARSGWELLTAPFLPLCSRPSVCFPCRSSRWTHPNTNNPHPQLQSAAARPHIVMREVTRAQQFKRLASFGLLGGVAMFVSGGSAR